MKNLDMLYENSSWADVLGKICDIYLLPEPRPPQSEMGHLSYNMAGNTFAQCGDGSEYILLCDGSIGFWGCEGQVGRIANSLEDLFEFLLNCPFWTDYVWRFFEGKPPYQIYQDNRCLKRFSYALFSEHERLARKFFSLDLWTCQETLARALGIELFKENSEPVLIKFFKSAMRSPHFIATYTEDDGSQHSSAGSIFGNQI